MNHKEQDQSNKNKKVLSKSNQNFDENTLSDLKLSPQEEITKLKAELKEKQEQINILQKENASNYSKLEYHYKQKCREYSALKQENNTMRFELQDINAKLNDSCSSSSNTSTDINKQIQDKIKQMKRNSRFAQSKAINNNHNIEQNDQQNTNNKDKTNKKLAASQKNIIVAKDKTSSANYINNDELEEIKKKYEIRIKDLETNIQKYKSEINNINPSLYGFYRNFIWLNEYYLTLENEEITDTFPAALPGSRLFGLHTAGTATTVRTVYRAFY
jgi:chromosome segregation ATPase